MVINKRMQELAGVSLKEDIGNITGEWTDDQSRGFSIRDAVKSKMIDKVMDIIKKDKTPVDAANLALYWAVRFEDENIIRELMKIPDINIHIEFTDGSAADFAEKTSNLHRDDIKELLKITPAV